jgi:hypothetical protein
MTKSRTLFAGLAACTTSNLNDSYFALVTGKFVTLRAPYPMGFFATHSTRTPFHNEGGKENWPNVVRFQVRPDPLAR